MTTVFDKKNSETFCFVFTDCKIHCPFVFFSDLHHHKATTLLPHHQLPVYYCTTAKGSVQQKPRYVFFCLLQDCKPRNIYMSIYRLAALLRTV